MRPELPASTGLEMPPTLLRELVDRMHDPVIVTRLASGLVVYVNRMFEQVFGWAPHVAVGRPTSELDVYADPGDRDEIRAFNRVGVAIHRRPVRLKVADGTIRHFLLDGEVVNHLGEPHSFAIVRDVDTEHRLRTKLDETERLLTAAGHASDLTIWDVDLATQRIRLHEAGALMEMPLLDRFDLMHPEDLVRLHAIFERAVSQNLPTFEGVYRLPSPHGDRWMQTRGRFERDPAGTPIRMVGLDLDVTESQVTLAALRQTRGLLDHLLEQANVLVVGLDVHGSVRLFNAAAERVTGFSAADIIGRPWIEIGVPADARPGLAETFERNTAEGRDVFEYENPVNTRSGGRRQILWRNSWHSAPEQAPLLVSFGIDVTAQRQAEQEVGRLAHTDALTGLPHRPAWIRETNAALSAGIAVAVAVLDVDALWRLNDAHGHAAGDEALGHLAMRLTSLDPTPLALGRLGGDVFLISFQAERVDRAQGEVADDAGHTMAALRAAVSVLFTAPLALSEAQWTLTASVGWAQSDGMANAETLLSRAERDLRAVRAGRGPSAAD